MKLELSDGGIIALSAIVISLIATFYPSRQAARLDPRKPCAMSNEPQPTKSSIVSHQGFRGGNTCHRVFRGWT